MGISKINNKNNRKKINKTRNLLIEDNEIDKPPSKTEKEKKERGHQIFVSGMKERCHSRSSKHFKKVIEIARAT